MARMNALATPAGVALATLLLAACAGPGPSSPAAADQVGNMEARLGGIGSAATGKVIVVDNGKGVTLTLDAGNGESSGPVWGPADSTVAPGELIPVIYVGMGGDISFSARIPGVYIDRQPSLRGRSVVLHAGPFVDSPLPGSPNNYIACGSFQNLGPGLLENLSK
jgi:hypothetical protein